MKNKIIFSAVLSVLAITVLNSCASIPQKAKPVANFEAERYLGSWYEIARFDYRFERNMDNVIAQYQLKKNGNINVFNTGYNYKKKEWKSATGEAKFRINKKTAALKVSFFKPFYSGYNVIAIDDKYKYALVAGKNLNYLWLLSREQTMPDAVTESYLKLAQEIGYDTSKLIWVKQDKESPFLKTK